MGEAVRIQPSVMFQVQKIIAASVGTGNGRMYQVQWAPAWVSGLHLVGCEHLIEEFLQADGDENHERILCRSDASSSKKNDSVCVDHCDEYTTEQKPCKLSQPTSCHNSGLTHSSTNSDPSLCEEVNTVTIEPESGASLTSNMYSQDFKSEENDSSTEQVPSDINKLNTSCDMGSSLQSDNQIYIKVEEPTTAGIFGDHFFTQSQPPWTQADINASKNHSQIGNVPSVPSIPGDIIVVQRDDMLLLGEDFEPDPNFSPNQSIDLENEWCVTEDDKFQCLKCNKVYKQKAHVTRHLQTCHHGLRPFPCPHCSKTFSLKNGLKRHLVLHTGVKSHKCGICDKTFSLKESLRRHFRLHTGEKPYQCNICGIGYSDKSNFRRHLQRCQEGKNVIVSSVDAFPSDEIS